MDMKLSKNAIIQLKSNEDLTLDFPNPFVGKIVIKNIIAPNGKHILMLEMDGVEYL